jgi:alkaline phosphatase D
LWQWRTDPPEFSAAFGSCAYINDEPYDRPGKPYGSDYGIFTAIAEKQPDLFIWGGDNTYLREPDWDSRSGMIYRQSHTRALPEMQPLLGSVHNFALWDDHDFGPNDADRTYRLRETSLEVFQLFWANQTYGTAETPGTFGRFVWNDVEFFLLDDRYHRSPNEAPDDGEKTMFGKEQLRWLKESLSSSTSNTNINFRIIVNGNQMLNPNGEYYESLTQYRSDYNELIGFIKKNRIPGIIFLSGDRHLTEMVAVKDSSFYPLYDYTSSSLTSALTQIRHPDGTPTKEFSNPLRVEGTLVNDKHNFGMLRFSGKRNERAVSLECYDLTGAQRWAKKISAAELRAH